MERLIFLIKLSWCIEFSLSVIVIKEIDSFYKKITYKKGVN